MKPTEKGSYVYVTTNGITTLRFFRTPADAQLYWTQLHDAGINASIRGEIAYDPIPTAK